MSQLLQHFGFTVYLFGRRTPPEALLHAAASRKRCDGCATPSSSTASPCSSRSPAVAKSLLLGELADQLRAEDAWDVHYLAHATTGPNGLINTLARKTGLTRP